MHVSKHKIVPRAFAPKESESIPLDDLVDRIADGGARKVKLSGRGTSTAIEYLQERFEDRFLFAFIDDATFPEIQSSSDEGNTVVFASRTVVGSDVNLRIAPWTMDDVFEYLMANAPTQCKSVMNRLIETDDQWLAAGSPEIWSVVLDTMIEAEEISTVEGAILKHVEEQGFTKRQRNKIYRRLLTNFFDDEKSRQAFDRLVPHFFEQATARLLSNQTIRYLMIAGRITSDLRKGKLHKMLKWHWEDPFTELVARRLERDEGAIDFLKQVANRKMFWASGRAASLLMRVDRDWRPDHDGQINFQTASLIAANWPAHWLVKSDFSNADLSDANLSESDLSQCFMTGCRLRRANLFRARLKDINAWRTDFSDANLRLAVASRGKFRKADFSNAQLQMIAMGETDLELADLRNADFSNANLVGAKLTGARIDGANFSRANLQCAELKGLNFQEANLCGAELYAANLRRSNLEDMMLNGSNMYVADFSDALLTGSVFRECKMGCVKLMDAKLAEIDWEDCDLRNADFSNCHFHMGSSRSGAVDSPYPSHGTRTGFYTDDYEDKYFKRPEQIRKAALCGCDLRGAKVAKADFYLVDLRRAKYEAHQLDHFRRCGAILD